METTLDIEKHKLTELIGNTISASELTIPTIAIALPEVLFVTSYPPRECGIATYSQDLLKSLQNKFSDSFAFKVCALESVTTNHAYAEEVKFILETKEPNNYVQIANAINEDKNIEFILVQHEFGFFHEAGDDAFLQFLYGLSKPVTLVFHTVLPNPGENLRQNVKHMNAACEAIIVMTKNAAKILCVDYGVPEEKISVIPHGTHLVPHLNKESLKAKYGLTGRKVLSTFGLLSSGKGIETTLESLPEIIKLNPEALFLIIGKTHPGVMLSEKEKYRDMLEEKVAELCLHKHVRFINQYLPLEELLEYLQLTDIYLFTSKDPNQAVSGTFSYAMSCGCPIISTPIPHAKEVLTEDTGIIIDFNNAQQLADGVNRLLSDEAIRMEFGSNTLHRIVPTAWENSAIAHAKLFQKFVRPINDKKTNPLHYRMPEINLEHVKKMTTHVGMIQFSKINQPDIESGFTLDDNARAIVAMCMHYELKPDEFDLSYIYTYLDFIRHCQQPGGYFLNYVNSEQEFTEQNVDCNLDDANGRGIWALGYLISKRSILPAELIAVAEKIMEIELVRMEMMHSTRAMAFAIKGLYYYNLEKKSTEVTRIIKVFADRLVHMFKHESETEWHWFESYLTYANSILPEALLCAWQETADLTYKETAKASFDFLLKLTFTESRIKVISNRTWLHKGKVVADFGEQPIDIAYTILASNRFYKVFNEQHYLDRMKTAFNWFLGNNHLHQIIYNPCTGGCYDGLEDTHVNLNQGAESTLSYLLARLTMEKQLNTIK